MKVGALETEITSLRVALENGALTIERVTQEASIANDCAVSRLDEMCIQTRLAEVAQAEALAGDIRNTTTEKALNDTVAELAICNEINKSYSVTCLTYFGQSSPIV